MAYSIENLELAFKKSLAFLNIIKANGYHSVDGNCQSFTFDKQVSKNINGYEETFTLSVTNQISGYVTATLIYRKKQKESSNTITIEEWLCNDVDVLDIRIKAIEKKCVSICANF